MTIQLRHLSSLLRAQPVEVPRTEVPGLAYYNAPERTVPEDKPMAAKSEAQQALDAMYVYYDPQG